MKDVKLGKPTAKTDVFSYGKTLMQLYSGRSPANCRERDLPEAVRHILFDCIDEAVEKRPAVVDLIVFFENALGLDKQRIAEELAAEQARKAAQAKAKAEKKAQADLQQKLADLEAKNAALSQEKQDALKQAQTLAAEIEALMKQTQAIQSEEQKARLLAELAEKQRQAAALAAAAASPKVSPSKPAKVTNFQETEFSFETVTVVDVKSSWLGLKKELITQKRQYKARQIIHKLPNGVPLEMVYIPEGELKIKGKTFHLKPFYMGKYAVTQAQYKAVMGENPSHFKGDNLPAESMYWKQAKEFCQKLGNGFRLPSEVEWEYACRAGTTTEFYFGDVISTDLVNYDSPFTGKTTPVGSFPPNAFGLYDMHGNVWEWCQDEWHNNFADASADGTAYGSENGDGSRLLRGGSWLHDADLCRSAFRYSGSGTGYVGGFRIVSLPPARILHP
jgi:formylglycine-generating enzyme required for sulfatase activity